MLQVHEKASAPITSTCLLSRTCIVQVFPADITVRLSAGADLQSTLTIVPFRNFSAADDCAAEGCAAAGRRSVCSVSWGFPGAKHNRFASAYFSARSVVWSCHHRLNVLYLRRCGRALCHFRIAALSKCPEDNPAGARYKGFLLVNQKASLAGGFFWRRAA